MRISKHKLMKCEIRTDSNFFYHIMPMSYLFYKKVIVQHLPRNGKKHFA